MNPHRCRQDVVSWGRCTRRENEGYGTGGFLWASGGLGGGEQATRDRWHYGKYLCSSLLKEHPETHIDLLIN